MFDHVRIVMCCTSTLYFRSRSSGGFVRSSRTVRVSRCEILHFRMFHSHLHTTRIVDLEPSVRFAHNPWGSRPFNFYHRTARSIVRRHGAYIQEAIHLSLSYLLIVSYMFPCFLLFLIVLCICVLVRTRSKTTVHSD